MTSELSEKGKSYPTALDGLKGKPVTHFLSVVKVDGEYLSADTVRLVLLSICPGWDYPLGTIRGLWMNGSQGGRKNAGGTPSHPGVYISQRDAREVLKHVDYVVRATMNKGLTPGQREAEIKRLRVPAERGHVKGAGGGGGMSDRQIAETLALIAKERAKQEGKADEGKS